MIVRPENDEFESPPKLMSSATIIIANVYRSVVLIEIEFDFIAMFSISFDEILFWHVQTFFGDRNIKDDSYGFVQRL
tara:strand:+ start:383 stop:613 length:231 start_codon:yes stop_codon:yes gene_type:complete